MIAYHYPPEGGSSGVLRALKFSKYLPANGWLPHVLTLKESFYAVRDEALLGEVPEAATVHRTLGLDTVRHLAVKGRHLSVLAIPDRLIGWLPFAVARGLRVIRQNGIEALYSTCPPPTAHLIAWTLKKITGLPWIADYRDPWIEEGIFPLPGTMRYRLESSLEKKVIRDCDTLVVTTAQLRREFLARYPELSPDKVQVIYNGFDEADFVALNGRGRPQRFEIIHAGLVTPDYRNPFPLLGVLSELMRAEKIARESVRVSFIGGGSWLSSSEFRRELEALELTDVVHIEARVSHREALERMAQAAVLLLLQASDDTRSLIPAKAFEYLRIGRPILALTLAGATADLLENLRSSYAVDPADRERVTEALQTLYDLWREGQCPVVAGNGLMKYEREHLTAELARVLGAAIDGSRALGE